MISAQSKGLSGLLQDHNSNSSVVWHSAFLMVQLSHPYTTTLTTRTFVGGANSHGPFSLSVHCSA